MRGCHHCDRRRWLRPERASEPRSGPVSDEWRVSARVQLAVQFACPVGFSIGGRPVAAGPGDRRRPHRRHRLAVDSAGNLYVSNCEWTYAAIHRIDADGMMTMFAGTGVPGFAGDGGPATSAQLYCPLGMTFAPDGALLFADHVNNRIRRVDSAEIITTVVGSGADGVNMGAFSGDGGPATEATLAEPYGVAAAHDGTIYVSDRDNKRIRKVDRGGIITTIAGNDVSGYSGDGIPGTQARINFPLGIIVDAAGNVLFADANNKRIRMIDGAGIITTIAGTGENTATGDGGPASKAALADPESGLRRRRQPLRHRHGVLDTPTDRPPRHHHHVEVTSWGQRPGH